MENEMYGSMREWYEKRFPDDSIGSSMSDKSFMDLFNALDNYKDVYGVIGVGDSIVRERLFWRLAEITGISYDDVYEQWLMVTQSVKMYSFKL